MEYPDRLSRKGWHQSMLIEEMERRGVTPLFEEGYNSKIEQAVVSAISEDGMKTALKRMIEGRVSKAKDGRIPAQVAADGYKLVDSKGEEGVKAQKDTHYAIREDRAAIIRELYERIAAAEPLRQIARDLEARGVSTPRGCKTWHSSTITPIIKNPVYKGEFVYGRHTKIEVETTAEDGLTTEWVKKRVKRPPEEQIIVPVPPIVGAALWQAANDMLAKNKQSAARNGKTAFLLGGMIKCAKCGYTYTGKTGNPQPQHRHYKMRYGYECRYGSGRAKDCHQRLISARLIENAVWKVVCDALIRPNMLLAALEADALDDKNAQIEQQIAFLQAEIEEQATRDDRLLKAYLKGAFDEDEYADQRKALKKETARLQVELDKLLPQRVSPEALATQREMVIRFSNQLRGVDIADMDDAPFELKQRILKMCGDRIDLNAREGWFELQGVLRGVYDITKSSTPRQFRRRASPLFRSRRS